MKREDEVPALLEELSARFERLDRPFAVLRNWEGLPRALSGDDLDLVVPSASGDAFGKSAMEAAMACGWQAIQNLRRPYARAIKLVKSDVTGMPLVFHLDLFNSASWTVFQFAASEDLLSGRVRLPEWGARVSDEVRWCHLIVHHLLWTGSLHKPRYSVEFALLEDSSVKRIRALMRRAVGSRVTTGALDWVASGGGLDRRLQGMARASVVLRSCLGPRTLLRNVFGLYREEWSRWQCPPGLLIRIPSSSDRAAVSVLLEWLALIWKYNHVIFSTDPVELDCARRTNPSDVVRLGYRNSRITWSAVERLRRKGWVVMMESDVLPCGAVDLDLSEACLTDPRQAAQAVQGAFELARRHEQEGVSMSFRRT
jgi:hypothetical protein